MIKKYLYLVVDPIEDETLMFETKEQAVATAEFILDEYRSLAQDKGCWDDWEEELEQLAVVCLTANIPIIKPMATTEFDSDQRAVWIDYVLEEVH